MDVLKVVGINNVLKSLIIFLVYGFLTTAFIAGVYGLESDLPDSVMSTLEGPISIYTFGWLSLFGLASLILVTKFGKLKCNLNESRPKRVFCFALPVCEAAIALGVVIGGTFLGIALCAHILFLLSLVEISLYQGFYGLSAFMFLITYPVVYFTIALLDSERTIYFWLNATLVLYALFIVVILYFTLPMENAVAAGIISLMFMLLYAMFSYLKSGK